MDKSFLGHLADDLMQHYAGSLSEIVIVFPNKRASVFFAKEASKLITKPIWMPAIVSISELFLQESELALGENLALNYELYKCYVQLSGSDESFDSFIHWGETVLNDFDDIDKYLIPTKDIFCTIRDTREIEQLFDYLTDEQREAIRKFWGSFAFSKLSKHQNEFVNTWEMLPKLYSLFKRSLQEKGISYEGMAYRKVAENIKKGHVLDTSSRDIAVAGFNALNECEKVLFRHFAKTGRSRFYWDYDNYYMDSRINEAGHFMRDNIREFPSDGRFFGFDNLLSDKKIEIIGTPTKIAQTKIASQILSGIAAAENDLTSTAVVLASENLLVPMLHSLPGEVSTANVTMGYPLNITPTFSFIDSLLELHRYEKNGRFYHKTVIAVLSHQFISSRFEDEKMGIQTYMLSRNAIYLGGDVLAPNETLANIFKAVPAAGLIAYLQETILLIADMLKAEDDSESRYALEIECMYAAYTELRLLNDLLAEESIELTDRKTLVRIIKKSLNKASVSFIGEPLSGLQILGVLETRLLDFKNLIVLSLNEGIFPRGKPSPSFIPYRIRTGFGIPTVKHQDSIFCYYFYRLLQRAENVWMLYSTQASDDTKGELSRYVSQLKYSGKFSVTESFPEFRVESLPRPEITVAKCAEVEAELSRYISGKGRDSLSPSAINNYIDCPLRFYFKYIAKLAAADKIPELLDERQFGIIFHAAMQSIFQDRIGAELSAERLAALAADTPMIEAHLRRAFTQLFEKGSETDIEITGNNAVEFEILKKYVSNTIMADVAYAPIKLVYLEEWLSAAFPAGGGISASISGIADRIDEAAGGNIRIIDYKTGKTELAFDSIEELFHSAAKRNRPAFQTLLYAACYCKKYDTKKPVSPSIYSIRGFFSDTGHVIGIGSEKKYDPITRYQDYAPEFENLLSELLTEIFDTSVPFTQASDKDICQFCDYSAICRRQ
jgi:hypothetical protein